ncbi:MAG: hypothetical protein ACFFKA_10370 [Candidatus Thorarchaeota archaeon]
MSQVFTILIIIGIISCIIIILIYLLLKKSNYDKLSKIESTYPHRFKCIDGHNVRSKGELIIDNYLYLAGLKHDYEKKIKTSMGPIKPDWYLVEYDVYIEYWGFSGKRYERRKKEKLKFYKNTKMKVISVENSMFSDIYLTLGRKIDQLIDRRKVNNTFSLKSFL